MKSIFSSSRRKNPHNNERSEKSEAPFFSTESKTPFFNGPSGASVQTKLTVGQPGDKYEKEADTMADAVVDNSSKPNIQNKNISSIQRESLATPQEDEKLGTAEQRVEEDKLVQEKPEIQKMEGEEEETVQKMENPEEEMVSKMEGEEEETLQAKQESGTQTASAGLSSKIKSKAGTGKKMSPQIKAEMESGFGSDFSNVTIHTDQDAIGMNKQLGAQAFTHGKDIYFNSGKYNPDTTQGKRLLAHELTHVVQQSHNDKDQINMQGGSMVLPAAGAAVPWSLFWKQVIKQFGIRGAAAAGLAAVDGPLPIGDIIAIGISIWTIYEIISLWDTLWAMAAAAQANCSANLTRCLENPWQPDGNRSRFGNRKDCGACYRECIHAGGIWPSYKCP